MIVEPWSFGEQPLPEVVELATVVRELTSTVLALEHASPELVSLIGVLRDAQRRLADATPRDLSPRIGAEAADDQRVYVDHSRDIGDYNPCFPRYEFRAREPRAAEGSSSHSATKGLRASCTADSSPCSSIACSSNSTATSVSRARPRSCRSASGGRLRCSRHSPCTRCDRSKVTASARAPSSRSTARCCAKRTCSLPSAIAHRSRPFLLDVHERAPASRVPRRAASGARARPRWSSRRSRRERGGMSALTTVSRVLRDRVAAYPDVEYVVCDDDRLTYAGAERRSRVLARGLLAAGAGRGSRIGLLFPTGTEFVTAWLATVRIGAIAVPISTFSTPIELRDVLGRADGRHPARCALVPRERLRRRAARGGRRHARSGPFDRRAVPAARLARNQFRVPGGARRHRARLRCSTRSRTTCDPTTGW